jgi:FKBP-type peptidyl-prolyl cis-trans isomerase
MNFRFPTILSIVLLLSACGNSVTGQKSRVDLKTNLDSVSYGIGTDIGSNLMLSGLEDINVDALAMGIRDAIDSAEVMTGEQVQKLVQAYMIEAQQKSMERQQAEGEANLVAGESWLSENGKRSGVVTTDSGLQYEVIKMGDGPKPTAQSQVRVHYRGTLIDGSEFDSSYQRGQPATFGVGQVIRGWTEALQLMPAGSQWKLYIPAGLAYGNTRGPGGQLPPNSALIFEVELLEVLD